MVNKSYIQYKIGSLRCSCCGVELDPHVEGYEVLNPGKKALVIVHLCDKYWQQYQEAKKWQR